MMMLGSNIHIANMSMSGGVSSPSLDDYTWFRRIEAENSLNASDTPALNGENVKTISDTSGNSADVTQGTDSKRGVFNSSDNSILTDGVDDEMSFPVAFNLQRYTIFAVFKPTTQITSSSSGVLLGPDGSLEGGFIYFGDATSRLTGETVSMLTPNPTDTYGVGITDNIPASKTLMTFRLDGTDEAIWIDGASKSLNTSTAGGLDSDGGLYLKDMRRLWTNAGIGAFADMSFYALFIMNSAASDEDRQAIEVLINAKYGL